MAVHKTVTHVHALPSLHLTIGAERGGVLVAQIDLQTSAHTVEEARESMTYLLSVHEVVLRSLPEDSQRPKRSDIHG